MSIYYLDDIDFLITEQKQNHKPINLAICVNCEDLALYDNFTQVSIWDNNDKTFKSAKICKNCESLFQKCNRCGGIGYDFITAGENPNNKFCPDCISKCFAKCNACGKLKARENMVSYDGDKYCNGECIKIKHPNVTMCNKCGKTIKELNKFGDCYECNKNVVSREPHIGYFQPWEKGIATLGIEVELESCEYNVDRLIPKHWGIHYDTTTGYQYEAVSSAIPSNRFTELVKPTMDLLWEYGSVNSKEGLHIHFGNFDSAEHATRFVEFCLKREDLLFLLCQPHRQNQSFCKKYKESDGFKRVANSRKVESIRMDRYKAINFCSWQKHGTIEIRMFEGNIYFENVENFVKVLLAIFKVTRDSDGNAIAKCCLKHLLWSLKIPKTTAFKLLLRARTNYIHKAKKYEAMINCTKKGKGESNNV